jgi:hypothetical protein
MSCGPSSVTCIARSGGTGEENMSSQTLELEGYAPQRDPVAVQVRQVTPGYLRAMRIPVLRGRDIVESDAEVLLLSENLAREPGN